MLTLADLGTALATKIEPDPIAEIAPIKEIAAHPSTNPRNPSGRDVIRPWRTGFCGPSSGPCLDKGSRCPFIVKNGSAASVPSYACACDCHTPGASNGYRAGKNLSK